MDTPMISTNLTVDEVLQSWPNAFSVFMKHKTKCPGCFLQHFCTLKDVAETYQISSQGIIDEIAGVANPEYTQRSTL
jgi:hypothetical protein